MSTVDRKPWRVSELNLVKGASRQRQAEDKLRADAWGSPARPNSKPSSTAAMTAWTFLDRQHCWPRLHEVMAPYIAEFDRLFTEAYPAEFAKATLSVNITPGGIPPIAQSSSPRRHASFTPGKATCWPTPPAT